MEVSAVLTHTYCDSDTLVTGESLVRACGSSGRLQLRRNLFVFVLIHL